MKIVLIGAKSSGKSTLGTHLSPLLGMHSTETDDMIEQIFIEQGNNPLKCNEIYDDLGGDAFRALEETAVHTASACNWQIIITGGSTFLSASNRAILREDAVIIFCDCRKDVLIDRLQNNGHNAPGLSRTVFLEWYKQDITDKAEIYRKFADIVIDTSEKPPKESALEAYQLINRELNLRVQSPNTLGELVRLTTFGESHGPAVGAVLDGIPAGIELREEDIQRELDRRKPGQSGITTKRAESDTVNILSGIFNNKTTGSPIGLVIYNRDSDPSKYEEIKNLFRPGHADITFANKYFVRDYRGGGRSSGRETASRVAGGAVAKKILEKRGVNIWAHTVEIGNIKTEHADYTEIENNILRCADKEKVQDMLEVIEKVKRNHDSIGGVVQLDISGLPSGLGDPVFAKIDARLTYAVMTIGAVKGIEIGNGFECAHMTGSTNNDQMENGEFLTNNAGGILGGITTGADIIMRIAVKPTPSIAREQKTIDTAGNNARISVEGRHDPCILPRIIPVIESMAALVLLDAWEIQSRLNRGWDDQERHNPRK